VFTNDFREEEGLQVSDPSRGERPNRKSEVILDMDGNATQYERAEIRARKTLGQVGVKYVAGSVELHEISLWATEEQITREDGIQIHAAAW
jgi:hypothetical protein